MTLSLVQIIHGIGLCFIALQSVAGQNYYVTSFATVTDPRAVRVDRSSQNVYVGGGDVSGVVSKVSMSTGAVTTFSTGFNMPLDLEFDQAGNVYVSENSNNRITKVPPAGGTGTTLPGLSLNNPMGLKFGPNDLLYILDGSNHRILTFSNTSVVTVLAPTPTTTLYYPNYITFDLLNNMYFTDGGGSLIRKITPLGVISIFAGSTSSYVDGALTSAMFSCARGIVYDRSYDALYVVDSSCQSSGNTIRRIKNGQVVTIVGVANSPGYVDGFGTVGRLNYPYSLSADMSGNLFVADLSNSRIRKINTCPDNASFDVVSSSCLCAGGYQISSFSSARIDWHRVLQHVSHVLWVKSLTLVEQDVPVVFKEFLLDRSFHKQDVIRVRLIPHV